MQSVSVYVRHACLVLMFYYLLFQAHTVRLGQTHSLLKDSQTDTALSCCGPQFFPDYQMIFPGRVLYERAVFFPCCLPHYLVCLELALEVYWMLCQFRSLAG